MATSRPTTRVLKEKISLFEDASHGVRDAGPEALKKDLECLLAACGTSFHERPQALHAV